MSPLPLESPRSRLRGVPRRALLRESGIALALVAALGVVAVPKRGTLDDRRAQRLLDESGQALVELRGAIDDYRRDHGVWPGVGHGGGTDEQAIARLGHDLLGSEQPYLAAVPTNPVNGRSDVRIVRRPVGDEREAATDGETGWVYDAATGHVWLNVAGPLPTSAAGRGNKGAELWMDL